MERIHFTEPTATDPFYREIKKRADFVLKNDGPDLYFWLKALFFFLVCWGTYLLIIFKILEGWAAFAGGIIIGLSGLLLGFSIGHDASHRVISKKDWVNKALHFVSFLSIGIDPMLWGLRHLRSHHLCPNVHGSDIDIDKNPLLRLSPDHPWKPMHRYQQYYAPFAYTIALLHSVLWGDWVYLISREYRWMRVGVPTCNLWLSFITFKILHGVLMLGIPLLVLENSALNILATYLLAGGVASLAFIIMLVGTHFFDGAAFPVPTTKGALPTSWVQHNLATSCDWNPDNSFARFISGGANCHAAHHLFPNICHTHYGKLAKLIQEESSKFRIRYHSMSLYEMIKAHFRLLRKLGTLP